MASYYTYALRNFLRELSAILSGGIITFILKILQFIFPDSSPYIDYGIVVMIIFVFVWSAYKTIVVADEYFHNPYCEEIDIIRKRLKPQDQQGWMGEETTIIALARNRGQYALPSSPVFEIGIEPGSKIEEPKAIEIHKDELGRNLGFRLRRLILNARVAGYRVNRYAAPFTREEGGKPYDVYSYRVKFEPPLSSNEIILYGFTYSIERSYRQGERNYFSWIPNCLTKEARIILVAPEGYKFKSDSINYEVLNPANNIFEKEMDRLKRMNMIPKTDLTSQEVEWRIKSPIIDFEYRLWFEVDRIQATRPSRSPLFPTRSFEPLGLLL
jgi:hypothetical protein